MANPLRKAIRSSISMNNKIGELFAKIGSSAHQDGDIMSDYKNARLSLQSVLSTTDPVVPVRDVLNNLRRQIRNDVLILFGLAIALGRDESQSQLHSYGIEPAKTINLSAQTNSAVDAVMKRFDAQAAMVIALVMTNAEHGQILGDDQHKGALSDNDVTTVVALWLALLLWTAFDEVVSSTHATRDLGFQKVAVAILDDRTTNCCLRVHGQTQPFGQPFKLTGTPRFADEMNWPGFHWWCRTAVALYLPGFDVGLTLKMRAEASAFLARRSAGHSADEGK